MYNFCSEANCTDGENLYAGLVLAADGGFYGTTEYGGANNGGTIYKITQSGTLTTLYSFLQRGRMQRRRGPVGGGLVQAGEPGYARRDDRSVVAAR